MYEKKINSVYLRELSASLVLYLLVLFSVTWLLKGMPASPLKTALALSPALPVALMFVAIIRHFQRMDEYMRGWLLENVAIAGGITGMFSITYGFLEGIDFPRLSMFVVWSIFMGSAGIIGCLRKWLER